MNVDILIKILSSFNKPFHYFITGIIILIFSQNSWHIWGWLLIGLSIASFIEWIVNIVKSKHKNKNKKKDKENKLKEEKERLYQIYDNLNQYEKMIVSECVVNNDIVYIDSSYRYEQEFLALETKGVGKREDIDKFIIYPNYFEWLKEYDTIKTDYKKYCTEEDKYMLEYKDVQP